MAQTQAELVKALVDAGVHFGHRVSRWNPKMEPYIRGKRNMIHIIDIRETIKGLLRAKKLVGQAVSQGKDVLVVGTKRQARHAVEEESKRCGMHYVSEQRSSAGTLTNFRTISCGGSTTSKSLEKLWECRTGHETYSKKMKSTLQREMTKIKTNLEGIRRMERMPGAMVIIDTRREHIAIKEAKKLGVTTIALIDTDSDPDLVDLPIPCNDDAMRAIEIILHELADAVIEGKQTRPETKGEDQGGPQRRRSARSQFKAEDAPAPVGGISVPEQIPVPPPQPAEPVGAGQSA